MAIVSYTLGDGTLKFDAGGSMNVSCQVTSATASCTENVTSTDDLFVLCGDELPGEETVTHTWQLAFNIVQDITTAGVIAWSWTNKGKEMAFEFIPNTAAARKVTGTVRVIPISVGGDVRSRPTADNTWQGKRGEDFVLADVA